MRLAIDVSGVQMKIVACFRLKVMDERRAAAVLPQDRLALFREEGGSREDVVDDRIDGRR
jgi:hypothetical protein